MRPIEIILFSLLCGVCLVSIGKQVLRLWKSNRAPAVTTRARVVGKQERRRGNSPTGYQGAPLLSVTFALNGVEEVTFGVNMMEYCALEEGDLGALTYQGIQFISFVPDGPSVEEEE